MFQISIFGVETLLFGGLSPQKYLRGDRTEFWAPCVARQETCGYFSDADNRIFRNTCNKSRHGYAIYLDSFLLIPTITGKHFEKSLRNGKKTTKNQKNPVVNTEMQANRGPCFYI